MPTSDNLKGNVAIVGIGHTKFARSLGRTSIDLVAEALQNALDDAGLQKTDIDGLTTNFGAPGGVDLDTVGEVLGITVRWMGQLWTHGRNNGSTVQWASLALHHGLANYVAIVFGHGDGLRKPMGKPGARIEEREVGTNSYSGSPPYGMTAPGSGAAMAARIYFHRYGIRPEDLGWVVTSIRHNATLNPSAMLRDPLSMSDYLNARYVVEPLRRWDYCLVNDGGAALILTTKERAKDLKKPPVYILGLEGLHSGREEFVFAPPGLGIVQQGVHTYAPNPRDLRSFQMAGVEPKDIDALYTYDAFSPNVWYALERFGFCKPGEAKDFCAGGRIKLGGELPINTSGGLLADAHLEGWCNHMETVRQLRHECGPRQVKDVEIAMYASPFGDAVIYGR